MSSPLDRFLLAYLEKKYEVKKGTPLYQCAALVLKRLEQGSVCVRIKKPEELFDNDFDAEPEIKQIAGFTPDCLKSPAVGSGAEGEPPRPLIYDGKNLYIQRYYVYQQNIVKKLEALAKSKKLHIITGGPGTGKTWSLKKRLAPFYDGGKKILLAAPTGKAAVRMKQALADGKNESRVINLDAKTIHRLLVSLPNSIKFRRTGKEDEQLEAAAIAIDECSMVDMPLMSKLLDAVPPDCDLYLLGDKNQLVSVEAGSVFADICAKFKTQNEIGDPLYTELTENRRAEKDTGIDELSKNILYRSAELNDFNCKKVKHCQNSDLFEFLAEAYRPLYNARTEDEALALLAQFQVLCAIKKGPSGTFSLNYRLKKYAEGFLENRKKTEKNAKMFYPLIIAENDYTHSLFNGDVGVSDGERAYFLSAEGKAEFPVLALPAHENAYAITIHKSQGSEYQKIAVVYPEKGGEDADHTILTRELLYTAVTRAREECAIFGSLEVLKESIKRPVFRASGIN